MRVGLCELEHDFYAVLEVPPSASAAEIRRAHRKMAARLHPDRAGEGRARAERAMKLANLAASVLLDPSARARYDALRARRPQASQPSSSPASSGFPDWPPGGPSQTSARPAHEPAQAQPTPPPAPSPRAPSFQGRSLADSLACRWTAAAAVAVTVLVGLLSSQAGGPVPVSSSDYHPPPQVQRVSMWAE